MWYLIVWVNGFLDGYSRGHQGPNVTAWTQTCLGLPFLILQIEVLGVWVPESFVSYKQHPVRIINYMPEASWFISRNFYKPT